MATGRGSNTYVAIAKESVAGTEEARLRSFYVEGVDLGRRATVAPIGHFSNVADVAGHAEITEYKVGGSTDVPLAYVGNGLGLLLEACLGSVGTTGAGPYDHAFTDGDLDTYSLEVVRGDTSEAEEFYGCMVDQWSLRFDPRGRALATLNWMGLGGANRAASSPTPPTLAPAPTWVMGHHGGTLSFNSVSYICGGLTVSGRNALAPLQEFGSLYPAEHKPVVRERFIEADVVWRASTLQAAHIAGTRAAFSLAFTSGSTILTIAATKAQIVEVSDPIRDVGYIRQRIKWQLFSDLSGPTQALTITLRNANATYSGS